MIFPFVKRTPKCEIACEINKIVLKEELFQLFFCFTLPFFVILCLIYDYYKQTIT